MMEARGSEDDAVIEELQEVFAKEGFKSVDDETGRRVAHNWHVLGAEPYPVTQLYVEHRNAGHPRGEYSDAELVASMSSRMPTNEWFAASAAYIRNLPHDLFMAVRLYQDGLPMNAYTGPAESDRKDASFGDSRIKNRDYNFEDGYLDVRADNVHVKASKLRVRLPADVRSKRAARNYAMEYICKLLDVAIANAPPLDKDITTYRLAEFPAMFPSAALHAGAEHCPALASNAFTSTSPMSNMISLFASDNWNAGRYGYLASFLLPKGTRCLYFDLPGAEEIYLADCEILLPRNACFEPLGDWAPGEYMSTQMWSPSHEDPGQFKRLYPQTRVLRRAYRIEAPV